MLSYTLLLLLLFVSLLFFHQFFNYLVYSRCMQDMEYQESLDYLYGLGLFSIKLGLSRVEGLLSKLGNPEKRLRCIHVAGTNGKGSVCTFISSVLVEEGYKVGVYTSPHLVNFSERIRINDSLIPAEDIIRIVKIMKPHITDHTFFEVVTVMAFYYFAEQKVDIAIIEVGLGGRLDATNVINPIVSVITNIGLEHTQHLGNTIEQISYEKAGIIKKGSLVVTGATGKALEVIKGRCEELGCILHGASTNKLEISMKPSYALKNASLALRVIKLLNEVCFSVSNASVEKGFLNAYWPGRFDEIKKCLIFDCAHNPAGVRVLVEELRAFGMKKINLVIGIMGDKDIKSMCAEFNGIVENVVVTKANNNRSADPKEVAKYFEDELLNTVIIPSIADALKYVENNFKGVTVVTGSIFVVGEAFSALGLEPFGSKIDKRRI